MIVSRAKRKIFSSSMAANGDAGRQSKAQISKAGHPGQQERWQWTLMLLACAILLSAFVGHRLGSYGYPVLLSLFWAAVILLVGIGVYYGLATWRGIPARSDSPSVAELELEHRRLVAVMEAIPVGLFICDADGDIVGMNPAAEGIWGSGVRQLKSMADWATFRAWTPDGRRLESRDWGMAHTLSTGEPVPDQDLVIETSDGKRKHIVNITAPIRDQAGNIVGAVAVEADVSERKQLEQKLFELNETLEQRVVERTSALELASQQIHAEEQRFHAMVDAVRDYAIFMLDPEGNVSTWNTGAERLKGYRADEIVGRSFATFYTEEDVLAGKPKQVLRIAREQGRYEEEGYRVRKDGSRFWANVVVTPLCSEDGAVQGFVKVTRDFTERRHTEEALKRSARELEQGLVQRTQAMEDLEAFSYSVSHDLRAPLRWVEGFARALEEDHSAQLDDAGKTCVKNIRESAASMSMLIGELLRLHRVAHGEILRTTVDITALASEIVAHLRREEPSREVDFVIANDLVAQADMALLRQALTNLLGNAWKFTRKQSPARIELGKSDASGETVFFVRDNGVGFDMKYASRLYRPFERLHSATEYEGMGIGLALVNRIIRRHGGRIWIESATGQGTTVSFTLSRGANDDTP